MPGRRAGTVRRCHLTFRLSRGAAQTGHQREGIRLGGELELKDRVAIVTGSARNIGRAIALELARAGAAVVVTTLQSKDAAEATAQDIRAAGGRAMVK